MESRANLDREEDPEPKAFKKKCPNIPSRDNYKEAELEKDDEFWSKWIKNPLVNSKEGRRINPEAVWEIAQEVEYG